MNANGAVSVWRRTVAAVRCHGRGEKAIEKKAIRDLRN